MAWCRTGDQYTNAGLLLIGYFSEILIRILPFSFTKMHLKMSSTKMAAIFPGGGWVNCTIYFNLCKLCNSRCLFPSRPYWIHSRQSNPGGYLIVHIVSHWCIFSRTNNNMCNPPEICLKQISCKFSYSHNVFSVGDSLGKFAYSTAIIQPRTV